jgi:hypothetical protein
MIIISEEDFKFSIGQIVATPGVLEALTPVEIIPTLLRHLRGDWGDLDAEDKEANDQSLIDGSRLLSAYHSAKGIKFWIITEWDRSVTTVLLPSEY